jgi:hypothetical protein
MPKTRQTTASSRAAAGQVAKTAQVSSSIACPVEEHPISTQLLQAFGTRSPQLSLRLFNQILAALPSSNGNTPEDEDLLVTMSMLEGIAPRDGLEGMLAAQMVAVHNAAMTQLRRAEHVTTLDGEKQAHGQAVKLLRTFTAQLEALNRYRGKGQQKVTVEHVHVNSGGQAIVGNVEHRKGRGERE